MTAALMADETVAADAATDADCWDAGGSNEEENSDDMKLLDLVIKSYSSLLLS